jgi:hypothetical protein
MGESFKSLNCKSYCTDEFYFALIAQKPNNATKNIGSTWQCQHVLIFPTMCIKEGIVWGVLCGGISFLTLFSIKILIYVHI